MRRIRNHSAIRDNPFAVEQRRFPMGKRERIRIDNLSATTYSFTFIPKGREKKPSKARFALFRGA